MSLSFGMRRNLKAASRILAQLGLYEAPTRETNVLSQGGAGWLSMTLAGDQSEVFSRYWGGGGGAYESLWGKDKEVAGGGKDDVGGGGNTRGER
jgi:hypothetical protein